VLTFGITAETVQLVDGQIPGMVDLTIRRFQIQGKEWNR